MAIPSFETKFIQAAGFNTCYLEGGNPANPKLVLVHDGAFGTTAELCWAGVLEDFARDFHVFAPELLGWGGTDKVCYFDRSPYASRIPHVAGFVEAVGLESADFVGTSFGGSLILRASVEQGNPWRITRAISITGSGGPYRPAAAAEALGTYTPSMEAAAKLTGMLTGTLDGLDDHVRQRHENSLTPGHWEALSAPRLKNPSVERSARPDDYLDRLAATAIPTLLVEGTRDPLLEAGWAGKMAALSPNITALVVEASHEPNIDSPQTVIDLVRNYLA